MSLRRPTAACTVFNFCYKPFMWCRPDARLWHYHSAFSARGVFQTLVWHPHYYSAFSARGGFQTLVWHQYYYSAFSTRGLSDTRLAPVLLFRIFPLEESFGHSFGTRINILQFPLEASFRPSLGTQYLLSLWLNALVDLFIWFMFTFVISYVRTVLRVLS